MALFDIRLRSGRGIWARSYYVSQTYAGVLEGHPDEEMSEWRLRGLPGRLQTAFGHGPVHIIEPTRSVCERASAWHGREIRVLPPIVVAADFASTPAKDESMHASSLIIAWYQGGDSPLISEENRSRLVEVDWEALAADFEY